MSSPAEGSGVPKKTYKITDHFFSNSDQDAVDNFNAGKSGIRREGLSPMHLNNVYEQFKTANPGVDPEDAIGITVLTGPVYTDFAVDYGNMVAETVLQAKSEDELTTLWQGQIDEVKDRVGELIDELNEGLAESETE